MPGPPNLCIRVFEYNLFLDPEIERSIAARGVFIGDEQLRASQSVSSPIIFFIGSHV
jgi:hypothetical protein